MGSASSLELDCSQDRWARVQQVRNKTLAYQSIIDVLKIEARLTKKYEFEKPNDRRALDLMNSAATEIVKHFIDIVIAYGQSDEYR